MIKKYLITTKGCPSVSRICILSHYGCLFALGAVLWHKELTLAALGLMRSQDLEPLSTLLDKRQRRPNLTSKANSKFSKTEVMWETELPV